MGFTGLQQGEKFCHDRVIDLSEVKAAGAYLEGVRQRIQYSLFPIIFLTTSKQLSGDHQYNKVTTKQLPLSSCVSTVITLVSVVSLSVLLRGFPSVNAKNQSVLNMKSFIVNLHTHMLAIPINIPLDCLLLLEQDVPVINYKMPWYNYFYLSAIPFSI